MCHHPTRAVGLEHGAAHDDDHDEWTRRDFLVRSGLAAAGASVLFGAPGPAFAASARRHPGLVGALGALETDNVLVMVQLAGGNDGLNTVVPVTNDLYYNARPDIAVAGADTLALGDDFGLHRAMEPLHDLWGDGQMGIVHSVGYDDHKMSHFDGIDAWTTARTDNEGRTGWTAEATYRLRTDEDRTSPPAVQVAAAYPLFSRGPGTEGPMTLSRPEHLDRIVATGGVHDVASLPSTPAGQELAFLRQVSNDADTYAHAMQTAAAGTTNAVEYPDETVGQSLAAVARLIKGRLNTRVYLVRLGTFDTHAGQPLRHHELLDTLAKSLAAFYRDLEATGDAGRTLTMTFSEFGRRVNQNGSFGTDHGTAAPLFLFGPAVEGGFHGQGPALDNLDDNDNLKSSTDFRSVYATVLRSWLGLSDVDTAEILGGTYPSLGLLSGSAPAMAGLAAASGADASTGPLALGPPTPNPVRGASAVRFSLPSASHVDLDLYDMAGRRVAVVATGQHAAGDHLVRVDARGLAAGTYVLRLASRSGSATQTMTVVR